MVPKIALVGVSGYGLIHFKNLMALAQRRQVEFAAAVVINPNDVPDQLAQLAAISCPVFDSIDKMFAELDGRLDLVCLPVGIPAHEPLTELCLKHHTSVLLEKPAAGSVAAVDRMRAAEAAADGNFVAIGFQHIYHAEVQHIKQRIIDGAIGRVRRVAAMGIWPRPDSYYGRNNWAGKILSASGVPIYDSPINNAFAHYLNLALFFSGNRFESSAHATDVEAELYRVRPEIETFDNVAVRFSTTEDVEIVCLFSHTAVDKHEPELRIEGDAGVAVWKLGAPWQINGKTTEGGDYIEQRSKMFADVLHKTSDRNQFVCTLDIAKEHTNCIEMLHAKATPKSVACAEYNRVPESGQYALRDIHGVWMRCFESGKLPGELNLAWKTK